MILYLDTSALVKAYVEEQHTAEVLGAINEATAVASHVIAQLEARSAFARLFREGRIDEPAWQALRCGFLQDWQNYMQVGTTRKLVDLAAEYVEVFTLRAYDSMHLAAARILQEGQEDAVVFACFDGSLSQAAAVMGLRLL